MEAHLEKKKNWTIHDFGVTVQIFLYPQIVGKQSQTLSPDSSPAEQMQIPVFLQRVEQDLKSLVGKIPAKVGQACPTSGGPQE
jgi:hypothetical protein